MVKKVGHSAWPTFFVFFAFYPPHFFAYFYFIYNLQATILS